MHEMTTADLRSAYGGESMAHLRYKIWGAKAEEEGFSNVARLFRAISYAEQVHGANHFAAMRGEAGAFLVASMAGFGLSDTPRNLAGAIEGETFEINEMYPAYLQTAKFQGEKGAETSFNYALSAEKIHAAMFTEAKASVDAGEDIELGPVRVCDNCGYTHEGDIPERCPVCGVGKDRFKSFQ